MNVPFADVEKFDETEQIDILETGKQDMSNLLSKLEKTIRDHGQEKKDEKPIICIGVENVERDQGQYKKDDKPFKVVENVVTAKDAAKIEKLLRKYKELKIKLKSKDWETFKNEQEKTT